MIDIEEVRSRYLSEQSTYNNLARYVRDGLDTRLRRLGLAYTLDARAKDVSSLVKKAMRDGKDYASPYDDIHDKAGVRVVVTYESSVRDVCGVIEELFPGCIPEDKKLRLPYDKLGYLGVHYEVTLAGALLIEEPTDYHEKICEIQVHTKAQNLWAGISHELLYKPAQLPEGNAQRAIYRLMALVEIFDSETRRARAVILEQDGFQEAKILDQLERQYFRFTGRAYDHELSLDMLTHLLPSLSETEILSFATLISKFVTNNDAKLENIFTHYANDDRCSPLLFQPESLLVFERYQHDRYVLEDVWNRAMPSEWLDSLTSIWGDRL